MAFDLEHHSVVTNGIRLQVVQCGPAAGPLVILLHGFPEFWYGWRHQIQALAAAGYRVWAPDQRGYNLSDKPPRVADYRMEQLGADILGLLDAAGVGKATLVGHDWGAAVTWWLAAHHPARLHGVAILNVPHPAVLGRALRRAPRQLLRSWYIFFFQLPWLPEKLFWRRQFRFGRGALRGTSRPGTFTTDDLHRYTEAWAQPGAPTAMLNWYRAAFRQPSGVGEAGRIQVPVRMLWGRHDSFLEPVLAQLSIDLCDQGELTYFNQATHWLHQEEPEKVNRLLLEFLRAVSPPVAP
ncbi:pimeloyl-ACP methyl ester carboxylesterase [Hymenobacter luteus]|uniref:Pimeloyl-ACP methyl ester carboxylesterase n=2 Tax=Hymenobacter TaxID=89966 RepID=A0A7W9T4B3_9BACT|nr:MULTISPECIES: alpha/beta hydrolase [Hymenobacter]MBB4602592.1 pimeloyl-ACP methyl ester carboxylesterase [Hymenobacter latericoloratus]MBB6060483.1 pimeloyl-ACP methyl ester carboxylesterase [Hymenobacter luteus]